MPLDTQQFQEFDPAGPHALDSVQEWASALDGWLETEDGAAWLRHLEELAAAEEERECIQAIHGQQ